jgi:hypothetical protein
MNTTIPAVYQENILNSPEVCSNCLRRVREERSRASPTVDRAERENNLLRKPLARRGDVTELDHFPSDQPTDDHVTWCVCGVESSYDQERPPRVGRDRLKELIQRCIATAEHKGISLDRQHLAATALQLHRDSVGPEHRYGADADHGPDCPFCAYATLTTDEILGRALEAARRRAVADGHTASAD